MENPAGRTALIFFCGGCKRSPHPFRSRSVRRLMQNPALNSAIQLIQTETGYAAYDPTTDQLHELNPTASLIVELCDGKRSVEEICAFLTPMLPAGSAEGVKAWIDEGVAAGLLVPGGDPGNAHRELSAEELHKISYSLRYRDKEEMALLCQQQAAALAPNDPEMWYDLGEMNEMIGRREDARAAYEKYMEFKPDDAEIRHILVALRGEPPPPRMPNVALEQMYAHFSRTFEKNLIEELGYKAPQQVREMIDPLLGDRQNLAVLDLGCGTGLAGVQFKPRAARLDRRGHFAGDGRAGARARSLRPAGCGGDYRLAGALDGAIRADRLLRLPDLLR